MKRLSCPGSGAWLRPCLIEFWLDLPLPSLVLGPVDFLAFSLLALLRHSKTDQYNQGKIIPISGDLSEMVSIWSLAIDQESGYILRSFKRNLFTKSSLTPASINHILKSLQKQAGLNQIGELSGHSFRVGAALDLLDKNIPLEKIMLRGGWKSETSAMRYLQSWNDSNWLVVN